MTATDESELVTVDEAARYLRMHRVTLRRRVRAGDVPKPIKLGPKRLYWRRSTLTAWLAAQDPQQAA